MTIFKHEDEHCPFQKITQKTDYKKLKKKKKIGLANNKNKRNRNHAQSAAWRITKKSG